LIRRGAFLRVLPGRARKSAGERTPPSIQLTGRLTSSGADSAPVNALLFSHSSVRNGREIHPGLRGTSPRCRSLRGLSMSLSLTRWLKNAKANLRGAQRTVPSPLDRWAAAAAGPEASGWSVRWGCRPQDLRLSRGKLDTAGRTSHGFRQEELFLKYTKSGVHFPLLVPYSLQSRWMTTFPSAWES